MTSPSFPGRAALGRAVRTARTAARGAVRTLPSEQQALLRRAGGRALRELPPLVQAPVRRLAGAAPARLPAVPAVTGRAAAAVDADPRAAARLEAALGVVDVSRTPSGGRAVGVVAADDIRAALASAGHRVVPIVPGTAVAVAERVEAVVVDLDGFAGVWDGALDATGVALFRELRAAMAAAHGRGTTCWVLSRGPGRHRLGALALLRAEDAVVVTAGADRAPAHLTEDPGDASLGLTDLLRACPEAAS